MGAFIYVTRESMPIFGNSVYDDNPIHTKVDIAKKTGIFSDTPVHGTRIAAYAEQDVLHELKKINKSRKNGKKDPLVYSGQTIKFPKPLYPETEAEWEVVEAKRIEDGLDLNISLMSEGEKLASGTANLRLRRPEFDIGKIEDIVRQKTTKVDIHKLEDFYECLGRSLDGKIAMMYFAAGIPSALLDLLPKDEKNKTPKGAYLKMELKFYNQPDFEDFETIIKKPAPPKEMRGGYLYSFEALCLQQGRPILSGEVLCSSETEVKFN